MVYNTNVGAHRHRPTENLRLQPGESTAKLYQAFGRVSAGQIEEEVVGGGGRWPVIAVLLGTRKDLGLLKCPTEAPIGAPASTN